MSDNELAEIRKRPAFLREAARYFKKRDTKGEDRAHWANVYNGENCEKTAVEIERLLDELEKLRERCEAYKGQVKAGSDEIERWKGIADNLTEEIELLRRDHADGLKVTGMRGG